MVALMKLRIKFGSEGARRAFQEMAVISDCSHAEKKTDQSTGEDIFSANSSRKRGPEELDEVKTRKKQKLDRNVFRQCSVLLKSMREHHFGWIFDKPVDPIKLNIPDYFSVISKPMDLSTIQCKLVKNGYDSAQEFAADVRLTFSNAMLYNPPENFVHKMAKELNEFFEVRWKSLERMLNSEVSQVETAAGDVSDIQSGEVDCTRQSRPETPAFPGSSLVSLSKALEEKARDVSLSSKSVEEKTENVSHSVRPTALATKLRLKKLDQGHFGTRLIVKCSSKVPSGCGRHDPFAAGKCGLCGKIACICLKSGTPSENCAGLDIASERPCRDHGSEASSIKANITSDSQPSKSDIHSDGSMSSLKEGDGCQSSQPQEPSNSASLNITTLDVPVSPKKALRAAILKSRFADTILKAKQRKILNHGNNDDPIKLQQEKERLERMQREERARIEAEKARLEAEIREAEAATRMRKETELRMERERQRLALQKMEEAVKIEENSLRVEREMKKLFGSDMETCPRILEKFGLFIKEDDWHDHEDMEPESSVLRVEFEEGEIL